MLRTMNPPPRAPASAPRAPRLGLLVFGLLVLTAPPVAMGVVRLVGMGLGRETLPDHARLMTQPAFLGAHIVSASLFVTLGALQFAPALRRSGLHARLGRFVALAGGVAAATGLGLVATLPYGEGEGLLLRGLRVVSGLALATCVCLGLLALRAPRDLRRHRAWMMRAYATGAATGTQFLIALPYASIVAEPSQEVLVLLLAVAWGINLAVAEWVRRRPQPQSVRWEAA